MQKKGFVGIYVFKTMYRKKGTVTIQYMFVFFHEIANCYLKVYYTSMYRTIVG